MVEYVSEKLVLGLLAKIVLDGEVFDDVFGLVALVDFEIFDSAAGVVELELQDADRLLVRGRNVGHRCCFWRRD